MFIDKASIVCLAGSGGKGCHSFDRSKPGHPSPTGGDGGRGGSIIIQAQVNVQTLLDFQMNRFFRAEKGGNGSGNNKRGHRGNDCTLFVPPGTQVFDQSTGDLLKDLDAPNESVVVCNAGEGGHGNSKGRDALEGEPGEEKEILLVLKLIADIGLVGFPNAGKSTLISRLSNAKSKIAAYPFTTKNPVLGVVKFDEGETKVLADIPGIIENAHEGKGMGLDFLKHIERTRTLVHVIDFACVDGRDPLSDYKALNHELYSYSPALSKKPQIVVANKMDVPEARERLKEFQNQVKETVIPISAVTGEGLEQLLNFMRKV